jgi:hypothetical protein
MTHTMPTFTPLLPFLMVQKLVPWLFFPWVALAGQGHLATRLAIEGGREGTAQVRPLSLEVIVVSIGAEQCRSIAMLQCN